MDFIIHLGGVCDTTDLVNTSEYRWYNTEEFCGLETLHFERNPRDFKCSDTQLRESAVNDIRWVSNASVLVVYVF